MALQVWSRFMQLAKEILSGNKDFKTQGFPTLRYGSVIRQRILLDLFHRCLTILAEKVTQTTAMEDKRTKKDIQVRILLPISREAIMTNIFTPGHVWKIVGFFSRVCQSLFRLWLVDPSYCFVCKRERLPCTARSFFFKFVSPPF